MMTFQHAEAKSHATLDGPERTLVLIVEGGIEQPVAGLDGADHAGNASCAVRLYVPKPMAGRTAASLRAIVGTLADDLQSLSTAAFYHRHDFSLAQHPVDIWTFVVCIFVFHILSLSLVFCYEL
jgi:hypothetical protein